MKAAAVLEKMRARSKPPAVLPTVSAEAKPAGMIHLHDLIDAGL